MNYTAQTFRAKVSRIILKCLLWSGYCHKHNKRVFRGAYDGTQMCNACWLEGGRQMKVRRFYFSPIGWLIEKGEG